MEKKLPQDMTVEELERHNIAMAANFELQKKLRRQSRFQVAFGALLGSTLVLGTFGFLTWLTSDDDEEETE